MTQQSQAEQELLRTQSDLRQAMARLKAMQAKVERDGSDEGADSSGGPAIADVEKAIASDPVVLGYFDKEEELKSSIAYARSVVRNPSDPAVVRLQQEMIKIQKRRKQYEARLRSQILSQPKAPSDPHGQAESSLAALEDEIGVLKEMEQELRNEVGKFTGGTKKLGTQALEMESIQDEISSSMEMAKLIGTEIEALKIELNAPDRVRVLKEAKAPHVLDSSRKLKLTEMAGGGAFGMVVLLVSFWEFRARRIDSQDEVTQGLGIKLVGTMPTIRRTTSGPVSAVRSQRELLWQHQLVESVETTRIMLTHEANAGSYRVVLVTSAVGGEGKTSLACHLATSLARAGQKTLLIDGDLRRPTVHRIFDQAPEPGFCELIRDEVAIDDVIRPTTVNNLWTIPAGHQDDHALAVLSQPRARELFDQTRERFGFVIVDSAPVLPVADTLLFSRHVDAVLFSILPRGEPGPQDPGCLRSNRGSRNPDPGRRRVGYSNQF